MTDGTQNISRGVEEQKEVVQEGDQRKKGQRRFDNNRFRGRKQARRYLSRAVRGC